MFIISRGQATVKQVVNQTNLTRQKDEDPLGEEVRNLFDFDMFGEVSMVYGCKRTCSVVSKNYCTLATISRPDYIELKRNINLSNFEAQLKKNMCFYDDPLKLFIEYELNKIEYFRDLSPITKNDIIFSMEQLKHSEGELISKKG
jgi:phosphoenolpyruvate synthase/pyruvate phosphate dikinase